jgi:hypothetical protein
MRRVQPLLLAIIAILMSSLPCLSEVSGSYIEHTPTEIGYLQLSQDGNTIDGSLESITSSTLDQSGYSINNVNLSGTAHGRSLFLRVDNGWLGKSSLFNGTITGAVLTIEFPQKDGHIDSVRFVEGSSSTWNQLVTTFESRSRELTSIRTVNVDRLNSVRICKRLYDEINADFTTILVTVNDFNLAHVSEAKAEGVVDQVNAVADQSKEALDRTQSDMNALQAAMNVDQANANAHQTDPVAYQSAQNAYQSDMKSYQADEATYQADASADEVATSNLYAAENSSPSSLWRATDRIWADIAKINQLYGAINADETNLKSLFWKILTETQQVRALDASLNISVPSDKTKMPTEDDLDASLNPLHAKLAAIIPKPNSPPTGHSGEVDVDSAAVRNYNPDDGSLHHDVKVLLTVMSGQRLKHIVAQTFNDYVIPLSDGSYGVISKADVRLDGDVTAANQ